MSNKKNNLSVLLGAAFLMATSAIGPGFMTQTSKFTLDYGADFSFVILISIIASYIAQLNVWRVIAVSKMRGQDIANEVLPGLGYVIAFLIGLGGLAFNIGNVGGAGQGIEVIFGIDIRIGAILGGLIGIFIFVSPKASTAMDKLTQLLGAIMIILIGYVAIKTQPPVGSAVASTFIPRENSVKDLIIPMITLIGGTVGGYIIFSGGHRLIDAGIVGEENLKDVTRSATLGVGVAFVMRVFLFLAVLGVTTSALGSKIDPNNIAPSAFLLGSGVVGQKIFGIVFSAAALTSIVGCAYTSVSFLKTLYKSVADNENKVIIGFIVISTLIFVLIGKPQNVLVVVGTLNGFILPISLAVILIASKKKSIVGDYKHPTILLILGIIVVLLTGYMGISILIDNVMKLMKGI